MLAKTKAITKQGTASLKKKSTCPSLYSSFSTRQLIESRYGLPDYLIPLLPAHLKSQLECIHVGLNHVSKSRYFHKELKFMFTTLPRQLCLLVCCGNDEKSALSLMHQEEYDLWLSVSLLAKSNTVAMAIMNKNKKRGEYFLSQAFKTGNEAMVTHLLDPQNHYELDAQRDGGKLLALAAQAGLLHLVMPLIKKAQDQYTPTVSTLNRAAKSGHRDAVIWLIYEFQIEPSQETINQAAASGNELLVVELLKRYRRFRNEQTLISAATSGNMLAAVLIEAYSSNIDIPQNMINAAATTGNLELVTYLINNQYAYPDVETLENAARSGNFKLFLYLQTKVATFFLNKEMLDKAANSGCLQLVSYLINKGELRPDEATLYCSILSGNTSVVMYILSKSISLTYDPTKLAHLALKSNCLEMVLYIFNPSGNFRISHPLDADKHTKNPMLFNICRSDEIMANIETELQKEHYDAHLITQLVQRSFFNYSRIHTSLKLEHILQYPTKYKLDDQAIKLLAKTVIDLKDEAQSRHLPFADMKLLDDLMYVLPFEMQHRPVCHRCAL